MDIDIYADVVCPWCYIGKRRLEKALARFDGDVSVTFKPFQLDPSTPTDARPLFDWLAPKFGGLDRARNITARTTELAVGEGIELNYDTAVIANTFEAHRLIWFARPTGRGPETIEALHRAHFTEGRNIGSRDELAAIAVEVGFDESTVREFLDSDAGVAEVTTELQTAHELGIAGVPTFVIDGKYAITGAQDTEILLGALNEVRRRAADAARPNPSPSGV